MRLFCLRDFLSRFLLYLVHDTYPRSVIKPLALREGIASKGFLPDASHELIDPSPNFFVLRVGLFSPIELHHAPHPICLSTQLQAWVSLKNTL